MSVPCASCRRVCSYNPWPSDSACASPTSITRQWLRRIARRRPATNEGQDMSTVRKRRVFVGSSTKGLKRARAICAALTNDQTEAVLWTSEFPPGYVTIEGLERVLSECTGAVFVATPDDKIIVDHKLIRVPRANVMLEFGLLAGRLGRHNIAICRYGNTEMPSYLKGLTVIEMNSSSNRTTHPAPTAISRKSKEKLAEWRSGLFSTADAIERTTVVHGYTGVWDFDMT